MQAKQQDNGGKPQNDVIEIEIAPDFICWCAECSEKYPQFCYWATTMQLELLILHFVGTIRQSNFAQYIASLSNLILWLFAMDHTNYARWASVHIRDMQSLPLLHPNISTEFEAGKFTVHKSQHAFSAIALDQNHEQLNALVKDSGGAIGLTENSDALLRWMIAGPEVAYLLKQFESTLCNGNGDNSDNFTHHEQAPGKQKKFVQHVRALVAAFEDIGNPFLDTGNQLVALDTKWIADVTVAAINNIRSVGLSQYKTYVAERLTTQTKSIDDPISRNNFSVFHLSRATTAGKSANKLAAVKSDRNLFARLYIGCQTRGANLDEFFKHENHAYPPALSENGQLRFGNKSELLNCLEGLVTIKPTDSPRVDCMVLDGAAVVQILNTGNSRTFNDYALNIFLPYI